MPRLPAVSFVTDSVNIPRPGADKPAWRTWARGLPRLGPEESQRAAAVLAEHLPSEGWVVIYDALPDEIDPAGLIDVIGRDRLAITRTPTQGLDLSMHPYDSPRETHPYGYEQPASDAPIVDDGDIAAVLVPGLAFDRRGVRLGRGKGYYDVTLARLDPSCQRIGVIAARQLVDRLPNDPHDVVMTGVCTSTGFVTVN